MPTARPCSIRCSRRAGAASGGPRCSTRCARARLSASSASSISPALERRGLFLEGTGSLVLDRANRIAYACLSPRTHAAALAEFGRALGYETRRVRQRSDRARPTRSITPTCCSRSARASRVLCELPRSRDAEARGAWSRGSRRAGASSSTSSFEQLHAFAGNLLELRGTHRARHRAVGGRAALARSARSARRSSADGTLVSGRRGTIERIGGGSVRCMLAEVASAAGS